LYEALPQQPQLSSPLIFLAGGLVVGRLSPDQSTEGTEIDLARVVPSASLSQALQQYPDSTLHMMP
jgi:hypothetical protein